MKASSLSKDKNQSVAHAIAQLHTDGTAAVQFKDNRPEAVAQRRLQALANSSVQRKNNNTGLPDGLKAGIENMSGYAMDDVKVHYNSHQPGQLRAHAYAQGTDIHVAPGQEKHLPHEAWHVVQQKQGRVKPTLQMKEGIPVNDDAGLENEADVMGNKAMAESHQERESLNTADPGGSMVQRKIVIGAEEYQAKESDDEKVTTAVGDGFIRYYASETEMQKHLVAGEPSEVGLIKKRALWYRIPFLNHYFFVLGESHAGVTGPDIKQASNITAPILYESYTGWDVKDYDNVSTSGNKGVDENSSKLLRALEIWDPLTLKPSTTAPPPATDQIPQIPSGEKSTRKTSDGSYRLVILGEDDKEQWWREQGQSQPPKNTYDSNSQSSDAITSLFLLVFKKELASFDFDEYDINFVNSWLSLRNETWRKSAPSEYDVLLKSIRYHLIKGVQKKVELEYTKLKKNPEVKDKLADPSGLTRGNDYRNEFMLASIMKGASSGNFAFAAVGDQHLQALRARLEDESIPFVSMKDFYDQYAIDAVDIPDRRKP